MPSAVIGESSSFLFNFCRALCCFLLRSAQRETEFILHFCFLGSIFPRHLLFALLASAVIDDSTASTSSSSNIDDSVFTEGLGSATTLPPTTSRSQSSSQYAAGPEAEAPEVLPSAFPLEAPETAVASFPYGKDKG
jgi:hypothetical protein